MLVSLHCAGSVLHVKTRDQKFVNERRWTKGSGYIPLLDDTDNTVKVVVDVPLFALVLPSSLMDIEWTDNGDFHAILIVLYSNVQTDTTEAFFVKNKYQQNAFFS